LGNLRPNGAVLRRHQIQESALAQIIPILLFLIVLTALNKLQTGRFD
jgi:hypothetical protein